MDNRLTAEEAFEELLNTLRAQKPNDRSDRDRYWAIVITEVEKAKAVYLTYARSAIGAV